MGGFFGMGGSGINHGAVTKRQAKRAQKAFESMMTVPVMANRAPWNELVLRGKRRVKTLSFNWKHRGPILLYTSLNRVDEVTSLDYPVMRRIKTADLPKGAIVGYATVVDVIPSHQITAEMEVYDPALIGTTGQDFVAILTQPKRFKKPIPFKPRKGAIRIFRAPVSLLKRPTL